LQPVTQYFYRIRGANQAGEGPDTAVIGVNTRIAAPVLSASNVCGTEIDLTWTRTGNAGYRLERAVHGGGFQAIGADPRPPTQTTYIDTAISQRGTYMYRVTAFNTNPTDQITSNVVTARNIIVTIDHSLPNGFLDHSDLTNNGSALFIGTRVQ